MGLRAALIRDVEAAAHAAEQQGAALVDEQRDVERYTGGLWAFLYGLVADVESRLTKEQLEAQPEFNRDTYLTERDAQRIIIAP